MTFFAREPDPPPAEVELGLPRVPPCPQCGYERIGLAADQPCPECGAAADPEVHIYWGECAPRHLTTQFAWYWTIYCGVGLFLIGATVAARFVDFVGGIYWILVAALGAVVVVWQRLSRDRRVAGSTQLRIGSQGWATRVGFGEVTWRKWPRRARVGDSTPEKLIVETPVAGWILTERALVFKFHSSADAAEARRLVNLHYQH